MKHWKVTLGTGLAWTQSYKVEAANEQEAVDMVADMIEEQELTGLYSSHYDLADCCKTGQSVDKYAEANGLVCCGNHGIYVQLLGIEEVTKMHDKCKEILNDLIDGEDAEEMIEQLRSLQSEGKITEAEYDYILEHWDELLLVPTTMADRIRSMTNEELQRFIYWVYLNGNKDGMKNLEDSYGTSFFGGAMLKMDAEELMPNGVEDLYEEE